MTEDRLDRGVEESLGFFFMFLLRNKIEICALVFEEVTEYQGHEGRPALVRERTIFQGVKTILQIY